jgi:hypothetical protein
MAKKKGEEEMKRQISIKELHLMASLMKYSDFRTWVASEMFGAMSTADSRKLTDKLYLTDEVHLAT